MALAANVAKLTHHTTNVDNRSNVAGHYYLTLAYTFSNY